MNSTASASSTTAAAQEGWRKRFLRSLGLYNFFSACRTGWRRSPLRLTNFFFQRIIGLNRECRWAVNFTSVIYWADRVTIHDSVRSSFELSGGCYFQGLNGIEIGEGTIFAPGVKLISTNHNLEGLDQWEPAPPIRIGKGCWLGANAVVLPGITLGDRVVVGAGSVVTRSFPEGCIVAGVPAKLLRLRDNPGSSEATGTPPSGLPSPARA